MIKEKIAVHRNCFVTGSWFNTAHNHAITVRNHESLPFLNARIQFTLSVYAPIRFNKSYLRSRTYTSSNNTFYIYLQLDSVNSTIESALDTENMWLHCGILIYLFGFLLAKFSSKTFDDAERHPSSVERKLTLKLKTATRLKHNLGKVLHELPVSFVFRKTERKK